VFEFEDEKFYDLKSYFQTLSSQNNYIADNELNTFFDWCDNHLITSKRIKDYKPPNSQYKPVDESWRCGLSIFVPTGPNQIGRYDYLPLYKYTKLENLMRLTLE
jgi:hypothetical protein